jgi:hypothetical protein
MNFRLGLSKVNNREIEESLPAFERNNEILRSLTATDATNVNWLRDLASSLHYRADALASTANFLKGHGWRAGAGYQPGEPNFVAIQGWNAASVYQQAIAYIGQQIDGR